MRKLIIVISILLLIGCKSKKRTAVPEPELEKAKITKLAVSEIDNSQKNKAYELGKRVLMTCNTSRFKPFNESEATSSVIKNTT